MKLKLGCKLAEDIIKRIKGCKKSPTMRVAGHETSFTRERQLTAERVIAMIIESAKQSLQARVYEFGVKFKEGVFATKQAFSKQRQFVNPEYIREFYDETAEEMLTEGELRTFKGMHLTAVDGTRIACENTAELIENFGSSGSRREACSALASVVYDVIERVSFDCQIGSYALSERNLLDKHLERLETFGSEKFLIIADRGYPSYDLIETLIDKRFSFLLRLSENWTNIISCMVDINDMNFQYGYNGNSYNIRALKIELENKTEYLVTNLDGVLLSHDEARHIYSHRWNIETFFGLLKTELDLENFSGKTKNAVIQEFYAAMTLANVCQCFINDANNEIAAQNEHKNWRYAHHANRRQCIGRIIPVFLECVFTDDKLKRDRLWQDVQRFCERFSVPVRPGRNPLRKSPRDRKFYPNARKPCLS
jgi:hypothetical protein